MTTRTRTTHDLNGYRAGCRCADCRAANTAFFAAYRRSRRGAPKHGTDDSYVNWACRCDTCTEAHRRAHRDQRGMV